MYSKFEGTDLLLGANPVANNVILVYRGPVPDQERRNDGGEYAKVNPEIRETSTHPDHQAGIRPFYSCDYNKYCECSEGDTREVANCEEPIQDEDRTDHSAADGPSPVEKHVRSYNRANPDAVEAIGAEIDSEIKETTRPEPGCRLTQNEPDDHVTIFCSAADRVRGGKRK